jgi:hypothetical protein
MPNHLSTLGIIHTAISILALLTAFYGLYREGKIDPASGSGKLYILLTFVTCVTGFPIMKTGHLTPGHYLAIIILVLLPLGIYARRIFGKVATYVQVIALSATLFLSLIPAIVESFTRLPPHHPLASGPNDPLIQNGLLALCILFIAGVIYQVVKLRSPRKSV